MPGLFEVVYSPAAAQDLEKMPSADAGRIVQAIQQKLVPAPFRNSKKLAGVPPGDGQWRFRVGDYRIRFDFVGSNRLLVFRIRHRREVYRF